MYIRANFTKNEKGRRSTVKNVYIKNISDVLEITKNPQNP